VHAIHPLPKGWGFLAEMRLIKNIEVIIGPIEIGPLTATIFAKPGMVAAYAFSFLDYIVYSIVENIVDYIVDLIADWSGIFSKYQQEHSSILAQLQIA